MNDFIGKYTLEIEFGLVNAKCLTHDGTQLRTVVAVRLAIGCTYKTHCPRSGTVVSYFYLQCISINIE